MKCSTINYAGHNRFTANWHAQNMHEDESADKSQAVIRAAYEMGVLPSVHSCKQLHSSILDIYVDMELEIWKYRSVYRCIGATTCK